MEEKKYKNKLMNFGPAQDYNLPKNEILFSALIEFVEEHFMYFAEVAFNHSCFFSPQL